MEPQQPATHTADMRRAERRLADAPIRMHIDNETLTGVSDNISGVGLMFFADEPLRVTVEIDENGKSNTYVGRLVRVQKMSESSTGYAIEFDPR